jgi:hypothetical protein
MPRPLPLAILPALALAGCLHATTVPVNLVSHVEFPPADRDRVWSRALVSLHEVGQLAGVDGGSEVATTELISSVMPCGTNRCDVTGTLQVIVTPVGILSARYNRSVSGELADEEVAALQGELDAWVAGVVGKRSDP